MAGRRTALRLLLLALILVGVFGMHTLGHPSGHSPPGQATGHALAMVAVDATASGVSMTMDPSDVCLAVLSALGIVVLLGAMLAGAGGVGRWLSAADRVTSAMGRGPPAPVPVGLRLANLSVSRM